MENIHSYIDSNVEKFIKRLRYDQIKKLMIATSIFLENQLRFRPCPDGPHIAQNAFAKCIIQKHFWILLAQKQDLLILECKKCVMDQKSRYRQSSWANSEMIQRKRPF